MLLDHTARRFKSAGRRALREVASLPLRALGNMQHVQALQKLTASMVSEVNVPDGTLRFMTPTPLLQWRADSLLTKEPDTIRCINQFNSDDVSGTLVRMSVCSAFMPRAATDCPYWPSSRPLPTT
jgi:hypothetical protein